MKAPGDPTFEPLFLALPLVAAALYWRAWKAKPGERHRAWLFGSGLVMIAAALSSPLETIATQYLLLFHLLQNVIISDWAPLLLVLGLTPAMKTGVARRLGGWFAVATRLRVAMAVWLLGWYVVHLAAFYDAALRNPWLLNVEHLVLIGIGLLFWWPLFSDVPNSPSTPARLAYLGVGFFTSMFLGLALTFGGSVFYGYYRDAPRLWGLSPLEDQNLAGILMTAEQSIVFLGAIAYFLIRLLNEEEARERLRASEQIGAPPPR